MALVFAVSLVASSDDMEARIGRGSDALANLDDDIAADELAAAASDPSVVP